MIQIDCITCMTQCRAEISDVAINSSGGLNAARAQPLFPWGYVVETKMFVGNTFVEKQTMKLRGAEVAVCVRAQWPPIQPIDWDM